MVLLDYGFELNGFPTRRRRGDHRRQSVATVEVHSDLCRSLLGYGKLDHLGVGHGHHIVEVLVHRIQAWQPLPGLDPANASGNRVAQVEQFADAASLHGHFGQSRLRQRQHPARGKTRRIAKAATASLRLHVSALDPDSRVRGPDGPPQVLIRIEAIVRGREGQVRLELPLVRVLEIAPDS